MIKCITSNPFSIQCIIENVNTSPLLFPLCILRKSTKECCAISAALLHHRAVLERIDILLYFLALSATIRRSPDRRGSRTCPGAATPVDLFGEIRYKSLNGMPSILNKVTRTPCQAREFPLFTTLPALESPLCLPPKVKVTFVA